MPARPTDRAPVSTLEKITTRINQAIHESAILQPVSGGVNQVARKLIFRALQHVLLPKRSQDSWRLRLNSS